jgi:two-component system, sensor histidine kinase and response regulator
MAPLLNRPQIHRHMNATESLVFKPPVGTRGGSARTNGMPSCSPAEIRSSILLVDDREDNLLALEAILAPLGQELVRAHSGREALRHLLQRDFALILLDVSMPAMDGFETAALIRQRPRSEHTPIIFVTSMSDSANYVSRGYALGAVDYIPSPVVTEVLRAKVSVFVDLHRKTALVQRQAEQLAHDIAARKEAEAQIRRLNEELEQRVTALTEANRELEAFNYSIAHDLRAPLRSMSGFAQALLEDDTAHLSGPSLDYARRIARSATYMDSLLRDLLLYSSLARAEITRSPVDLEEPVHELLAVLDKDIRDRQVKVEVSSPLGTACAHLPTLKQLLANLISNSLKFTSADRPPQLRISTTPGPGFVRLWIEDNGIGIAPENHERIFGLFTRLNHSPACPGTGIGLALVRKGAERMGGRVGVESELGQGSRFWVDIPATQNTCHGGHDSSH